MKVKDGVKLRDLQFIMREVLITADKIWSKYGQELVVTSTGEGVHSPGSLHYYGLAVDFRNHYFNDKTKKLAYKDLLKELGDRYTVILEDTHVHVQVNLKANTPNQ
jgi:hypothetical protein